MALINTGSLGTAHSNLLSSSLGCAIAWRPCQGQQSYQSGSSPVGAGCPRGSGEILLFALIWLLMTTPLKIAVGRDDVLSAI